MKTAADYFITDDAEQEMLVGLDLVFEDVRSRIALMNIEVFSTFTDMYSPLTPRSKHAIDITLTEFDELDLTVGADSTRKVLASA